jgi:hypothetical protein
MLLAFLVCMTYDGSYFRKLYTARLYLIPKLLSDLIQRNYLLSYII